MKQHSPWLPLVLTLTVLPGMGHFYLNKKFKGFLFAGLSIGIVIGGIARYFSVLFALANLRGTTRPPHFSPFELMAEAWKMDLPILLGFLFSLVAVWVISALDVWVLMKEGSRHEK